MNHFKDRSLQARSLQSTHVRKNDRPTQSPAKAVEVLGHCKEQGLRSFLRTASAPHTQREVHSRSNKSGGLCRSIPLPSSGESVTEADERDFRPVGDAPPRSGKGMLVTGR